MQIVTYQNGIKKMKKNEYFFRKKVKNLFEKYYLCKRVTTEKSIFSSTKFFHILFFKKNCFTSNPQKKREGKSTEKVTLCE